MTKRLLSVAIALLMVLSLVPMAVFAAESDNTVAFTIPEQNVTDPQVGDTITVPVILEPGSGAWIVRSLIEYDPNYLLPIAANKDGEGTLYYQIEQEHEEFDNTNASIYVSVALTYVGGTGTEGNVAGEVGKMYTDVMFVVGPNGETDGLYAGGVIAYITYRWIAVPEESTVLPLNITYVEAFNNQGATSSFANRVANNGQINVNITAPVVVDRTLTLTSLVLPNASTGTPQNVVTLVDPQVGQYFWLYLKVDIPEGGNWFTLRVLFDYNEDFLNPLGTSGATWNEGIIYGINAAANGGDYSSDKPSMVNNVSWQIGENSTIGEEQGLILGNKYTQIAAITDTIYEQGNAKGVTVSGYLVRIRYNWTAIPTLEQLAVDENGYYLPIDIAYAEAQYCTNGTIFPDFDEIVINNAKIYLEVAAPQPEEYTVTFVDGLTNTTISTVTAEEGSAITYPAAPEHEGYTFIGWNPAAIESLEADTTVTAQYAINSYNVYYYIEGQLYATQTYEYGQTVTAPEYEVPFGYIFSGWDTPDTMPANDVHLYATLTAKTYTITINYYRWSDLLDMWVAAQSAKTITVTYGDQYDVNDQIPETIDEYVLDDIDGDTTGTVTGNITIDAYYVKPYEPEAPVIASNAVELRNRATEDGKKDVRFIFTVLFNDANVNYNGEMVGKDPAYFEITALGATVTAGKTVTMPAKNIYEMGDSSFTFTIVITGIQEKNWDITITAVPYMTDVHVDGDAVTVYGAAIETTVNQVIAGE